MSALDIISNGLKLVLPTFRKSDATIESKIIDVVGTYADSEAIERKNTLDIILNALANQRITTKDYYRNKAVQFQIGDELSYDPINQGAYYKKVNKENQIVKQSYIVGDYPNFYMLVNALGQDGHLRPLTSDELASFKTYFEAFQPLGINMSINSLNVAKISDDNMVIYVRAGANASEVVDIIKKNLLDYEATLRKTNTVSLSEIEDVIQQANSVVAVGWDNPLSTETQLDGTTKTTYLNKGVFELTNGAFTFSTEITTKLIKVII